MVLSGHTHRAAIIMHQSSSLHSNGYEENSPLLLVASGTGGGTVSTKDFPMSFNIIDISKDISSRKRRISITPYLYSSLDGIWEQKLKTEYYL